MDFWVERCWWFVDLVGPWNKIKSVYSSLVENWLNWVFTKLGLGWTKKRRRRVGTRFGNIGTRSSIWLLDSIVSGFDSSIDCRLYNNNFFFGETHAYIGKEDEIKKYTHTLTPRQLDSIIIIEWQKFAVSIIVFIFRNAPIII